MAIEIHVPDIGADEVEVTEILVNVGDKIELEQSLITVEGDKASLEVPASQAGVVKEIKVNVGDTVATGSLIMLFDADEQTSAAVAENNDAKVTDSSAAQSAEVSTKLEDITIPDIGGDEVEVTEILVAVGDTVAEEQSLITVEGDKASMEVPAPMAGVVKSIKVNLGDTVSTGSLIMAFEVQSSPVASAAETAPKAEAAAEAPVQTQATPATASANNTVSADSFVENAEYAHASPVIRRLAREFGVNLAKVKGSGRKGRVVKGDVQNFIKAALKSLESGAVASGGGLDLLPWPKVDFAKFGETDVQPLSRIKKISGANLHRNWAMIPHVTQFDEADISELEAFRKAQNAEEAKQATGLKLTPLVFILKAVAKALASFPSFNASLSEDGENLILKKYIHIGIAVDTPNGLVVPVVRDVDRKGIYELSQELVEISAKARAGKLTASDMQGGCFTISSLGGLGGTAFTPIVNAPEVAILGVSKSEMKPKWNGKEFVPRLMLPLSLSYDHRVIDGAQGAKFTTYLASLLADIRKLIL